MELIDAIKKRGSVRKYKPDHVEDEKLMNVLEAARWAPSWANTQCWQFIIIKDGETKKKLSETLAKGNPSIETVIKAPIILVACGKKGVSGFYKGSYVTDKGEFWYMFDVALALQNLTLAACSLGLGTVHVALFDAKKAEEILGVPENVSVVELIPLGYPVEQPREIPRKEVKDFIFYEHYGQKT